MRRPSIRVKLMITSKDDDRFSVLRTFNSIPDASSATGFTGRGIRAAYHLKQESMQKRSVEVYNLKWEEPDPIGGAPPGSRLKYVSKPAKKDLTSADRSSWFFMDRTFVSLCRASKKTGISICALRNACSKANMTITR